MVYTVHHVPGRLRIRNLEIKGCARSTARYCDVVRCLPGVYAVKGRAVTGSVLMEYDPHLTDRDTLLGLLQAKGAGRKWAGEKIAEKIGHALMQCLIERALLGALI
jgi:hypothetical protein